MLSLARLYIVPSPWIVDGRAAVLFKQMSQQIGTAALFNFLPMHIQHIVHPEAVFARGCKQEGKYSVFRGE